MGKITYSLITLTLILLIVILYSLNASLLVPTFHLDGAFQTASSLLRLSNGEMVGRDFFPYLGVGPIISLLPAFLISGSNLFASVFASNFMVLFFGLISFSFLFYINVKKDFNLAILFGLLALLITVVLSRDFYISPGNSLKPIRAALPYLVGIVTYFTLNISSLKRTLILAIFSGFCIIWSNDFAYVTIFSFSLFYFFFFYLKEQHTIKHMALHSSVFILSAVMFLYFSTDGHIYEYLSFNFVDIKQDQWWYFAPYFPQSRIISFYDLYKFKNIFFEASIFAMVLFFVLKRYKNKELRILIPIATSLLLGGIVPSVGGHLDYVYFTPFKTFTNICYILFFLRIGIPYFSKLISTKILNIGIYLSHAVLLITIFVGAASVLSIQRQYAENRNYFYVPQYGAYLHQDWFDYIAFIQKNSNFVITEEYFGLASALNYKKSIWPVDSVIHALGETRLKSSKALASSDFIVTSKKDFNDWQSWSVSQNYWFYNQLFSSWEPVFNSPLTTIWKKSTNRNVKNIECEITSNKKGYILKSDYSGIINLQIKFLSDAGNRNLILAKNNMTMVSGTNHYVSINPRDNEAYYPVQHNGNDEFIYDIRVIGEKKYLELISCIATYYDGLDKIYEEEITPSSKL